MTIAFRNCASAKICPEFCISQHSDSTPIKPGNLCVKLSGEFSIANLRSRLPNFGGMLANAPSRKMQNTESQWLSVCKQTTFVHLLCWHAGKRGLSFGFCYGWTIRTTTTVISIQECYWVCTIHSQSVHPSDAVDWHWKIFLNVFSQNGVLVPSHFSRFCSHPFAVCIQRNALRMNVEYASDLMQDSPGITNWTILLKRF